MFWKRIKKSKDTDENKFLNEVLQTKGFHRDLLEVQSIKANTKLAERTLQNLKYQNITNLAYLVIGAFIPIIYNAFFNPETKRVEEIERHNQGISDSYDNYKSHNDSIIQKIENEIILLKNKK